MTEKNAIYRIILVLAECYGKKLSEASLKLFANALGDVTADELERAIAEHMRSELGRFYPSPGDLLCYIRPKLSATAIANECVTRVLEAVTKFGWVDPVGAKEYLGDLVWDALPGASGWLNLCTGELDSAARAQLRERIIAKLAMKYGTNPKLPPIGNPEPRSFVPMSGELTQCETEKKCDEGNTQKNLRAYESVFYLATNKNKGQA